MSAGRLVAGGAGTEAQGLRCRSSRCVDMVEVVGKELCLVCALEVDGRRRCGWLAGGLI